jgi:hypothetical protein
MFDPEKCAVAGQNYVACSSADECATNSCVPSEVRTTANFAVIVKVCR